MRERRRLARLPNMPRQLQDEQRIAASYGARESGWYIRTRQPGTIGQYSEERVRVVRRQRDKSHRFDTKIRHGLTNRRISTLVTRGKRPHHRQFGGTGNQVLQQSDRSLIAPVQIVYPKD